MNAPGPGSHSRIGDGTTKTIGSACIPCALGAQRDFRVGRTVRSKPEASPPHIPDVERRLERLGSCREQSGSSGRSFVSKCRKGSSEATHSRNECTQKCAIQCTLPHDGPMREYRNQLFAADNLPVEMESFLRAPTEGLPGAVASRPG
jgi:hypothetical protein